MGTSHRQRLEDDDEQTADEVPTEQLIEGRCSSARTVDTPPTYILDDGNTSVTRQFYGNQFLTDLLSIVC